MKRVRKIKRRLQEEILEENEKDYEKVARGETS